MIRLPVKPTANYPQILDYSAIDTLSKEAWEKLAKVRLLAIGQVARTGAVSPTGVNALLVYLELRSLETPYAQSMPASLLQNLQKYSDL